MADPDLKDFFDEFNAIVWKTYDTFSALSSFESFWREMERLVAEAAEVSEKNPHWDPGIDDLADNYHAKRRMSRHLHDEVVTPTFRYAAVITLFSVIEKRLKVFADTLADQEKHPFGYKDLRGGLFEQLSRYTEVYRGFQLSQLRRFDEVRDLQRVRNCLVHNLGEVAMMTDKTKLLKLNSSVRGLEVVDGCPIGIEAVFIETSLAAARAMFHDLFARVGWKVNDKWLMNPP